MATTKIPPAVLHYLEAVRIPPASLVFLVELIAQERSTTYCVDIKEGRVHGWRSAERASVRPGRYAS